MATEKAASRRKWSKNEIVGDETVEVDPAAPADGSPLPQGDGQQQAPVSDAIQSAADAPQAPEAEELIAAQPEITVTVRVEHVCGITSIERARALPELPKLIPGDSFTHPPGGIQAFKSTDGRTLLVVVSDGNLYSQEK